MGGLCSSDSDVLLDEGEQLERAAWLADGFSATWTRIAPVRAVGTRLMHTTARTVRSALDYAWTSRATHRSSSPGEADALPSRSRGGELGVTEADWRHPPPAEPDGDAEEEGTALPPLPPLRALLARMSFRRTRTAPAAHLHITGAHAEVGFSTGPLQFLTIQERFQQGPYNSIGISEGFPTGDGHGAAAARLHGAGTGGARGVWLRPLGAHADCGETPAGAGAYSILLSKGPS